MELDGTVLVIAIIAVSYAAWLANNWIRARNGYALEDEWGGKTERSENAEAGKLRAENAELRELVGRMEQRMRALETIVTDKGYGVAEEIEALRGQRPAHAPDAGVLLEVSARERT